MARREHRRDPSDLQEHVRAGSARLDAGPQDLEAYSFAGTTEDDDLVILSFSVPIPTVPEAIARLLTEAERDVVLGIIAGKSNAEIASARQVSVRTVANQVARILRTLGVGSRWEIISRCAGE